MTRHYHFAQVHGFQRNKPAIEEAEAVLARTPHPIAVPGLAKLAEGVRTARAWLQKAATAEQGQPCELRSLESLATEGNRLPVALPQLKASISLHTCIPAWGYQLTL